MTTPVANWSDFDGPRHDEEMATAHQGAPSVAQQSASHGAYLIGGPAPDVDNGPLTTVADGVRRYPVVG